MGHLHIVVYFGLGERNPRSLGVIHECVIQSESGHGCDLGYHTGLSLLHNYL